MILTDYFQAEPDIQWHYARQAGVEHAVLRLPEDDRFRLTDPDCWRDVMERFIAFGIRPLVIEPLPDRLHRHIKLGDGQRDQCIETLLRMFPLMERWGISTLCCNFMAHVGWCRTSRDMSGRGGALVTGFSIEDYRDDGFQISREQLWFNLAYFLKAVLPEAERHGIKLALHPDDPPVPWLGGTGRILTCLEEMERAVHLVDSPNLGVTLCQGTFAAMGEDVCACIRRFSRQDKLFFVHFRDIKGERYHFQETFHDNGQTDMNKTIRAYLEEGFNGPIRVDHVPTMAGEKNDQPGYAAVGRLFAIGYLKGLLEANGGAVR